MIRINDLLVSMHIHTIGQVQIHNLCNSVNKHNRKCNNFSYIAVFNFSKLQKSLQILNHSAVASILSLKSTYSSMDVHIASRYLICDSIF